MRKLGRMGAAGLLFFGVVIAPAVHSINLAVGCTHPGHTEHAPDDDGQREHASADCVICRLSASALECVVGPPEPCRADHIAEVAASGSTDRMPWFLRNRFPAPRSPPAAF